MSPKHSSCTYFSETVSTLESFFQVFAVLPCVAFFSFSEPDSTHSVYYGSSPFGPLPCILLISHQQTLCPISQHLWFSSLAFLQASWLPAPTSTRASKDKVLIFSRQNEGSQSEADKLNNVVADCPVRRVFRFSASAVVHRPPLLPHTHISHSWERTVERILPVHLRVTSIIMLDNMVVF